MSFFFGDNSSLYDELLYLSSMFIGISPSSWSFVIFISVFCDYLKPEIDPHISSQLIFGKDEEVI